MQLNNLIPRTKNKKTMIVGRGGKRGKTSGRGGKGQTARAGHKKRPELRDFIKRVPKLRGRGVNGLRTIETKPVVVNLDEIEALFNAGDTVNPSTIIERGIVSTIAGKVPAIKILSVGELSKKLTFSGCTVSSGAKSKIEKVGGSVQL